VIAQIYVHNVACASRKVRVLRPFVALGLMMMSLLCCLARYGLHYNHWTDVVVGFVTGLLLAIYIVSSKYIHGRHSPLPGPNELLPPARDISSAVSSPFGTRLCIFDAQDGLS